MTGLFYMTFLDFVYAKYGENTMGKIVMELGGSLDTPLYEEEIYSDELWHKSTFALSKRLKLPKEVIESAFAKYYFADFQRRWPAMAQMCSDARDFIGLLPSQQQAIHEIVFEDKKTEPCLGALRVEDEKDETVLYQRSALQLEHFMCALA